MNNLKDIHNTLIIGGGAYTLFYQDVNEQFEGYTQRVIATRKRDCGCFIRMSMNNLKDIHNVLESSIRWQAVVLSGCQ